MATVMESYLREEFPSSEIRSAKISSPQVGQFVGLVRKLDALMISMDTLWLSSVLSNKQRVDPAPVFRTLH